MVLKERHGVTPHIGIPREKLETYKAFLEIQQNLNDRNEEIGGLEAFFSPEQLSTFYEVHAIVSQNGYGHHKESPYMLKHYSQR